jgi:glycosyltransferase involved in cell wall biosynthesis
VGRTRRILSVGHAYGVAGNRRLLHELARESCGRCEVVAVAPEFFHGDLRPVTLERDAAEPIRVLGVPLRGSRVVHLMAYGGALGRVLRQGWDLVHCFEEPYVLAGAQVAWATPSRSRLVYFTAQNIAKRYPPPLSLFERLALARASGWIGCGVTVGRALADRPGYRDRAHRTIPYGVDVEAYRPDPEAGRSVRERLGWDGRRAVVGFLGRFVPAKGVELLTRVLDRLPQPWNLLLVGSGPLETALARWAAPHGARVRIVTDVRHEEVPAYLNAMDVVCVPSLTTRRWREQFGRVLIEAFACGVAVIGSDSGEVPHVIGDAGVVVGEADEAGWQASLGRLLDDAGARRDYAERGRARAHATYAWSAVARRHLQFFDELMG